MSLQIKWQEDPNYIQPTAWLVSLASVNDAWCVVTTACEMHRKTLPMLLRATNRGRKVDKSSSPWASPPSWRPLSPMPPPVLVWWLSGHPETSNWATCAEQNTWENKAETIQEGWSDSLREVGNETEPCVSMQGSKDLDLSHYLPTSPPTDFPL